MQCNLSLKKLSVTLSFKYYQQSYNDNDQANQTRKTKMLPDMMRRKIYLQK